MGCEITSRFRPLVLILTALTLFMAWTSSVGAAEYIDVRAVSEARMDDFESDGSFETIYYQFAALVTYSHSTASAVGSTHRVGLEFDLSSVSLPRPIRAAYLRAVVDGTATPDGVSELSLSLNGYTGDGLVTLGDAHASNTVIGSLTIGPGFDGFGEHFMELDLDFVAPYVGSSDHLGILTRSVIDQGGIYWPMSQYDFPNGPFLRIVLVPEPNMLILTGIAAVCLLAKNARNCRSS